MIIKILGTGCDKCDKMFKNATQAASNLGIDASVEKVEGLKEIMKYGVMSTPALVIDDEVKLVGRVATVEEIMKFLEK